MARNARGKHFFYDPCDMGKKRHAPPSSGHDGAMSTKQNEKERAHDDMVGTWASTGLSDGGGSWKGCKASESSQDTVLSNLFCVFRHSRMIELESPSLVTN